MKRTVSLRVQMAELFIHQSRVISALIITALLLFWNFPNLAQTGADEIAPTAAGDLDTTFGTNGKVVTDFFGKGDGANAVAVQDDGKIIAAGLASISSSGELPIFVPGFGLARYSSNGTLDAGFGTAGKVTTAIGQNGWVQAIAIQPDGKIVAAGTAVDAGQNCLALARYFSNGTLDTRFGAGALGKVITHFPGTNAFATAVALQDDGKIVVAGYVRASGGDGDFVLVRYQSNGTLDTSFGLGGKVTTDFVGKDDQANAMLIQPDGKIVAAGYATITSGSKEFKFAALARYNPDGSLDPSFVGSYLPMAGKVILPLDIAEGGGTEIRALAIQHDNKIVALCRAWFASFSEVYVCRLETDGQFNRSFGNQGYAGGLVFTMADYPSAVSIDPLGKVIAAGYCYGSGTATDFALGSLNSDGSPDTSFGSSGKVMSNFGGFEFLNAMSLQNDGRIVVAGSTGLLTSSNFILARYVMAPDFAISFESDEMNGDRGTKLPVHVNILRGGGFAGEVTVTAPDLSSIGVKLKPPDPITTTDDVVTFKLKIKGGATTGKHELVFTATDGAGRTRTAKVNVTIN